MDYSSEHDRQASAQRKLAFASRWALDGELEGYQDSKPPSQSTSSILYEPCALEDTCVSLPVELFALSLEDLAGTIFTPEVWKSLDPTSRAYLTTLLPSGPHAPTADVAIQKLFSGENIKFGNPMNTFTKDLLAGEFNAEVQKYKQQATRLAQQQRLLSMKLYHNKMVKHALEHKRKLGMKVDEAVIDFYRTQPDDSDLQEKRRLDRAQASLAKRISRRKGDKQFSSLLAAATTLAAKQDAEGTEPTSSASYKLAHALSDIGVQLPMKLQIGLPYGDDELFLSDDDDRSSSTASQPSDNEADIDELLDEMESSATGGADGKRRNTKKRKRGGIGDDADTLAEANGDDAIDTTVVAGGSVDTSEKKRSTGRRKKLLPPLPLEEVFSLFPTIRSATNLEQHPNGVPLTAIVDAVNAVPKLVSQLPHDMSMSQVVSLAVSLLLLPHSDIGFVLNPRKTNPLGHNTSDLEEGSASSSAASLASFVPFLTRRPENDSYIWALPAGHAQNDLLESLEAIFFFAITRRHFTVDGKALDLNQTRACKAQLTLSPPSEASIAEYREQEAERYQTPDQPYTFRCSKPLAGHCANSVSPPNRKTSHPGGRRSAILRADLPEKLSSVSLIRDALARLPGGVGTRADIASLILQSQYLAPDVSDISHLSGITASSLDRIHLEYDSSVRYDVDLRLYIYLHRQRTEEDFNKMWRLEEKARAGDTGALWTSFHDNLEQSSQTPVASLSGFLQSNTSM